MSLGGFVRRTAFWHDDKKNNDGYIRAQYDQVMRAIDDPAYALAMQQSNLAEYLEYMTRHSSFYSKYSATEDLLSFPVMKKLQLIEHHDAMVIDPADIPHQRGDLYIQRTSGSTGIPFAVPQDTRKRQRRIAEVKALSALNGYESHEPLAQCRVWTKWQYKTSNQSKQENIFPVNVLNVDDDSLAEVCELIRKNRIVAIRGYASWFTGLMNHLKTHEHDIPKLKTIKVCITHSEALEEATRDYLGKTLGCNMCECYANEECGIFGQQKTGSRSYELNNTGYVFELLKLDSDEPAGYGELGRIVVTDLHQRAFPVIRYDTGDTGIFSPMGPDSPLPHLEKIYGRKLDLVFDSEGKPIHPMSFNRILKNLPSIRQWQFAQMTETSYELRLIVSPEFAESSCVEEIRSFLGERADLKFVYVDEIPRLKNGKFRSVVCEWDKDK